MHYHDEDDPSFEAFEGLGQALGSTRFPSQKFPPQLLATRLLLDFDCICKRHEELFHSRTDISMHVPGIWEDICQRAMRACKSTTAKRAMWAAIGFGAQIHGDAHVVKATAAFLQLSARYKHKNAKEWHIEAFAGEYTPGQYSPVSLLAAAQAMALGQESASEHIRQWLHSLALAPGVLPVQKYKADTTKVTSEALHNNAMLWQEVVIPFCQCHPKESFLSEHVFFHLPINPNKDTAAMLVSSLSSDEHQQWLYANMLGIAQNLVDSAQFWSDAFKPALDPLRADLRLYLALLQLNEQSGKELSHKVDPQTAGMLDSLGDYSNKSMANQAYSRWLDRPREATMALPDNWFDEATVGF